MVGDLSLLSVAEEQASGALLTAVLNFFVAFKALRIDASTIS
jgi:hypothetical protein